MNPKRRHSVALVLVGAIFTACLGPDSAPEIRVEITTDLFEITPDTSAIVELRVSNDGWEPVLVGVGCPFYFVHDAENAPVSSPTCIPEAFLVDTVAPGGQETLLRFDWNGHRQGLAPGPYRIETTILFRSSLGGAALSKTAWVAVRLIP